VRRNLECDELRVFPRDLLDQRHYCFLPARIIGIERAFLFDRSKRAGRERIFAASLVEK
jgi:hypothetical protein